MSIPPPSFSQDTPNKIGNGITVVGKTTLIKTDVGYHVAIADESIDTKVDGRNMSDIGKNTYQNTY